MQGELYNKAAQKQLQTHALTYNSLFAALSRLHEVKADVLNMCDLGAGPGYNTISLMKNVFSYLEENGEKRPIQLYFNDLPSNDNALLIQSINEAQLPNNVFPAVIGRSFYEQIMPNDSVHLSLSYITLHWMSRVPCPLNTPYAQESGTEPEAAQAWEKQSYADLRHYFELRQKELVKGCEAIALFVGGRAIRDNGWIYPEDGGPSILTRALLRAESEGSIPGDSLQRVEIPFFSRSIDEARAVVESIPGLEVTAAETLVFHVGQGSHKTNANMFWAIHKESIANSSGFSAEELSSVRRHVEEVAEELYGDDGVAANYSYIAVRKTS